MSESLCEGDIVRVKIDRISNSGNPIALIPSGYIIVPTGEVGEEKVVKLQKRDGILTGVWASDASDSNVIELNSFYEKLEEIREKQEDGGVEKQPVPEGEPPEEAEANERRLKQLQSNLDRKTSKEKERENLNYLLRGNM